MMSQAKKFLSIDNSDFTSIVKSNCLYIDKTEQIYGLINQPGKTNYFLARPRRFGKTLLIDTLKQIFLGKKELFKETWIYNSDWKWEEKPVIHLDMSLIKSDTNKILEQNLAITINKIAKHYQVPIPFNESTPGNMLQDLILALSKKYKIINGSESDEKVVVVLIDEYDYGIVRNIENKNIAQQARDCLKDFYIQLKGLSSKLAFVFVTGVSKFSQTTLHSGLNHLTDLTMEPRASTLLGYTESELDQYFNDFIKSAAAALNCSIPDIRTSMKIWYNGYRFSRDSQKVYNPFSLHRFLDGKFFENHWFSSGNPAFLFKLMEKHNYPIEKIENISLDRESLLAFDIDKIELNVLLYQTGYLTITDFDQESGLYVLSYPNREVSESFLKHFLDYSSHKSVHSILNISVIQMAKAFQQNNLQLVIDSLYHLFTNITYDMQINSEQYYQSVSFVVFYILGFQVKTEVKTNLGRIDMAVFTEKFIYIFEFKYDKTAQEAINQILGKKYYEKFKTLGKSIILVGANFSSKEKNIEKNGWISMPAQTSISNTGINKFFLKSVLRLGA